MNALRRLRCWLGGHAFVSTGIYVMIETHVVPEVVCLRCGRSA